MLDAAALAAPDGRDEYSPLEARGDAPRALRARRGSSSACRRRATTPPRRGATPRARPPRGGGGAGRRRRAARARARARGSPRATGEDERRATPILASLAANDARARPSTRSRARVRGGFVERAARGAGGGRRARRITVEHIVDNRSSRAFARRPLRVARLRRILLCSGSVTSPATRAIHWYAGSPPARRRGTRALKAPPRRCRREETKMSGGESTPTNFLVSYRGR